MFFHQPLHHFADAVIATLMQFGKQGITFNVMMRRQHFTFLPAEIAKHAHGLKQIKPIKCCLQCFRLSTALRDQIHHAAHLPHLLQVIAVNRLQVLARNFVFIFSAL